MTTGGIIDAVLGVAFIAAYLRAALHVWRLWTRVDDA